MYELVTKHSLIFQRDLNPEELRRRVESYTQYIFLKHVLCFLAHINDLDVHLQQIQIHYPRDNGKADTAPHRTWNCIQHCISLNVHHI